MVCVYFRKDVTCELLGICTLVCVNKNFQIKDHSISVDQAKYATSIVAKYLDTTAVKASTKFYNTSLTSDMIFTKESS